MKKLVGFVGAWTALAVAVALSVPFKQLNSVGEWLLLVVIGPPAYLLVTALGELAGEAFGCLPGVKQSNAFIERSTKGKRISFIRIIWYLAMSLIVMALVLAITWAVRAYF